MPAHARPLTTDVDPRRCRNRARPARPFPLEPLLAAVRATSDAAFARRAEVHRRQVARWRDYGMTLAQADTLACRLGFHPIEVWPAQYRALDDDDPALA